MTNAFPFSNGTIKRQVVVITFYFQIVKVGICRTLTATPTIHNTDWTNQYREMLTLRHVGVLHKRICKRPTHTNCLVSPDVLSENILKAFALTVAFRYGNIKTRWHHRSPKLGNVAELLL